MSNKITDSKIRAQLRGMANRLPVIFKVGKELLTDTIIDGINDYLYVHEMIKIELLKQHQQDYLEELVQKTQAEVVETKGNTVVLYKYSYKQGIKHIL